jgi:hypothetical protein
MSSLCPKTSQHPFQFEKAQEKSHGKERGAPGTPITSSLHQKHIKFGCASTMQKSSMVEHMWLCAWASSSCIKPASRDLGLQLHNNTFTLFSLKINYGTFMALVVSCSQNTVTNTRCLGVFASSSRKILQPQSASQVSHECPRPSHHKDSRIWTMFCLVSSWAGVLRSTVQFQKKKNEEIAP